QVGGLALRDVFARLADDAVSGHQRGRLGPLPQCGRILDRHLARPVDRPALRADPARQLDHTGCFTGGKLRVQQGRAVLVFGDPLHDGGVARPSITERLLVLTVDYRNRQPDTAHAARLEHVYARGDFKGAPGPWLRVEVGRRGVRNGVAARL